VKDAIADLKNILQLKPDHPNRTQIEKIIIDLKAIMDK
jgi:hypothetical protein